MSSASEILDDEARADWMRLCKLFSITDSKPLPTVQSRLLWCGIPACGQGKLAGITLRQRTANLLMARTSSAETFAFRLIKLHLGTLTILSSCANGTL